MSNSAITILVVDDNPATRYSTSRILRSAGWTVIEAETGEDGYQKALQGVDLLVLDVNLPDVDGITVCRRLREQDATARLPILHLSATFVTTDNKVSGLEAGADGYLTHPIEPPVLIATVNAFLRTRQAEIELRSSEARFKSIFENALTGVALLNSELCFTDANPTMCYLLGFDRQRLFEKCLADVVPLSRQRDFEKLKETLSSKLAWHGQLPIQRPTGQLVHLEWYISSHADPDSHLVIVSDISDRLRYEEERESLLQSERAARAEAERANRMKDDFLATLSHELRTPLNAIVGWSQLLQTGKLPPNDVKEGVAAIERNARAQAEMISDLLDVSRITTGKIRLAVELLDPATVIEAAVSAILPTAEAKSIRIKKILESRAGPISGDPSRLQQVIWNLINNAVKFTPEQGQVEIALQRVGSDVEICIRDSGQGIRPDLLPTIFDRFQQGDSSSTREHGGLGLGLAIAKQLVALHGGAISATSPGLDQGAQFTVSLPLATSQIHRQGTSEPTSAGVLSTSPSTVVLVGKRILLVEDDADSRKVLQRMISSTGAEVYEVADVTEALIALESFKPELLISDLGMPGRDGFQLISEVRRRGYTTQKLPAVALTAFARAEDRRRALQAGFQVHLAKPVDPAELHAVLTSLISQTN